MGTNHTLIDETLDDLLHGELKIIQPRRGFRYSVDALLLAAFALPLCRDRAVLDLGAGTGVVALILAKRGAPRSVTAVEIQASLADMLKRNAGLNPTGPPVVAVHADAMDPAALGGRSFGLIVSNPPFRAAASGHPSPNREKALARHEIAMELDGWLGSARSLLHAGGSLCLVYPVNEEKRLFAAAGKNGLHLRRVQYALERPGGERKLLLVELRKETGEIERPDDVPIETPEGRFGVDGYG